MRLCITATVVQTTFRRRAGNGAANLGTGSRHRTHLAQGFAEMIAKRMWETPHQHTVLQEQDIEHVLQRFEEQYQQSLLSGKFVLDTTSVTVDETLAEFAARKIRFSHSTDRLRMMTHQALQQNHEFFKLPIDS